MQKNSIDIFIPYWGDLRLLKTAINSVLGQTNENWRLTIIDDNYPGDAAKKYCKSIKDKRVRYIKNNKNLGITNNFNKCVRLAKSKYVMIMGCDDELMPNYTERTLSNIGEADFYQPGVDVIDSRGKKYLPVGDRIKKILQPKKSGIYYGEKLASSLCIGNWLYFPSITWKTETIRKYGFNKSYTIVQDVYLELSIIKDGGTLYFDKEISFRYRRHAKSMSSTGKGKAGKRFEEEEDVYMNFARVFNEIVWIRASKNAKYHITPRTHKLLARFF